MSAAKAGAWSKSESGVWTRDGWTITRREDYGTRHRPTIRWTLRTPAGDVVNTNSLANAKEWAQFYMDKARDSESPS